jgi:ApaG protein
LVQGGDEGASARASATERATIDALDVLCHLPCVRTTIAEATSFAVTDGIRVKVQSLYLPDQSSPRDDRYVFAYTITISNEGAATAQLRTRHWIITDARGTVEEVRGDGVVGEQPRLAPGQSFQYTSGCVLNTPVGTMHGTYRMWRDDGSYFDAEIAPFSLASPTSGKPNEAN